MQKNLYINFLIGNYLCTCTDTSCGMGVYAIGKKRDMVIVDSACMVDSKTYTGPNNPLCGGGIYGRFGWSCKAQTIGKYELLFSE